MTVKNADMPAMPTPYMDVNQNGGELYCDQQGMTKREDIAKHLMANLIQGGAISEIGNEHWYAKRACELTDALLAELEKPSEPQEVEPEIKTFKSAAKELEVKKPWLTAEYRRIDVSDGKCTHGVSINEPCEHCYFHIPF